MAEPQDLNAPQPAPAPAYPGPIRLKKAEGDDPLLAGIVEEEMIKKHMDQFQKWADLRQPLETLWTTIYSLLFTQGQGDKVPTRAKIVLPIVFQIIESALPKIVTVIFGQPEWFQAKSRSSQSPVPNDQITAFQELLAYQLELCDYFPKFVDFFKSLFMYGTAYLLVYWTVRREWVYERTPNRKNVSAFGQVIAENQLSWDKKLSYKVVERRPEIDVIPIEDVYPDMFARDEKAAEGVYITSSISMAELEEKSKGEFPIYGNFEKVKNLGASNKYFDQTFKQSKRGIRGTGEPLQSKDKGSVELTTYWGREDIDNDGIREEVQLVFANRQVLVRAVRNPFEHQKRPLIRGVLFPVPGEWFGMGLIEPTLGLINELITVRRQHLDQNTLILNRMWKVYTMADVDLDTLVTSANGIILTSEMDGVVPVPQEPLPGSVVETTVMLQTDIENATAPKSIQGAPAGGSLGRTARGAQLIISQALEKFGLGAKLLEESVVKKVLVMFKQLDEQFLDSDEVIAEFYGQVVRERLTPEQIRLDVDFKLLGISETVTREASINQLMAAYNLAAANPLTGAFSLELFAEIMRLMQTGLNLAGLQQAALVAQMAPPQPPTPGGGAKPQVSNQIGQNGTGGGVNLPNA